MRPFGIFRYVIEFILQRYTCLILSVFTKISDSEGEVKKQKNIVLFTACLTSITQFAINFDDLGSVDISYLLFSWFILYSFFILIGGIFYSIYIKHSDKLPETIRKVEYTTEEVRFNKITEDWNSIKSESEFIGHKIELKERRVISDDQKFALLFFEFATINRNPNAPKVIGNRTLKQEYLVYDLVNNSVINSEVFYTDNNDVLSESKLLGIPIELIELIYFDSSKQAFIFIRDYAEGPIYEIKIQPTATN